MHVLGMLSWREGAIISSEHIDIKHIIHIPSVSCEHSRNVRA
jgi:hypothetical protein